MIADAKTVRPQRSIVSARLVAMILAATLGVILSGVVAGPSQDTAWASHSNNYYDYPHADGDRLDLQCGTRSAYLRTYTRDATSVVNYNRWNWENPDSTMGHWYVRTFDLGGNSAAVQVWANRVHHPETYSYCVP